MFDTSVTQLLTRMARLLRQHGERSWGAALERFAGEYECEPVSAVARIRALYGGMGALNDVVLHDESGEPLRAENDELDRLRNELYEQCRA